MKAKEKISMSTLSPEELKSQIALLSKELVTLKRERYTKQSKNVRAAKNLRLKRAILSTVLRQKEQGV